MEKILSVKNIAYSYDDENYALKNVSVDFFSGEKIAVIGANGAGKSTFFLNLNGVLSPDCGEIFFRGEKIGKKNLNTLRKNVGIVFQDAESQIIASTVFAEVSFGPVNMRLPKNETLTRTERAMEYMNITELRDRPPHYLSGGEKKRVSIADIIAMTPEIIIFDEPTEGLDPLNAQMLEEALSKLSAEGKTLILSTHNVDFAYRWAERIIVFNKGEIIADSEPEAVFKNEVILKSANLSRPATLDIYESLAKKGFLKNGENPRSVSDLKKLIEYA